MALGTFARRAHFAVGDEFARRKVLLVALLHDPL